MTQVRLNRFIELLEQGKTVFGAFLMDFSTSEAVKMGDSDYDFCVWDFEHGDSDIIALRNCLQFMLNRRRIVARGDLQPDVAPFARIAANARERNEWQFKQVLDQGVYGVMFPHATTAADILAAVKSCRYPLAPGEPRGHRGTAPARAARYWGMPASAEYVARADVWPVNPAGELAIIPQIEDVEAVSDIDNILREVKGLISGVMIGEVDLSVSMGLPWQVTHPEVMDAMQKILRAAQKHHIPCGCLANAGNVVERIERGYRFLLTIGLDLITLEMGRCKVGRA